MSGGGHRCWLLGIGLLVAMPLAGQSLQSRFNQLFIFGDCGLRLCLAGSDPAHQFHFVPFTDSNDVSRGLLRGLSSSIVTSVSNTPASVASGGATVEFVQGLPVTTPISAGPILGERAPTLSRHRLVAGVNLTGGTFDRLNGIPLRKVRLNFVHQDVGNLGLGDPSFENDIIAVTPDFHFKLLVTSLFATYGLANSLDIGIIVPVIHASLKGRSIARLSCENPCVHAFGTPTAPQLQDTATVDASATGVGDMTLRAKLGLPRGGRWSFALLGELRLPTGREENFMGEGALGWRAQMITSATWGVFTSHFNAGYLGRSGTNLNDAAVATAGFDVLALSWLTVAGDVAGQLQAGSEGSTFGSSVRYDFPVRTLSLSNVPDRRDDRLDGSLGIKLTNSRGLTGLANLYFPLRGAGLQAPLLWTLGAQYDF